MKTKTPKRDASEKRIKQLEAGYDELRKICNRYQKRVVELEAQLAAAKVEELREFRSEMRKCPDLDERDCIRVELFLDDFIAALERGKDK